ncbi:XdhC family protein [Halanaerobiaceae bacterium Z-7014]|uniref:XdhC family protein n=1 Tax=Halonatronomonas betaini TaxID=2778430 RepID=A0A931AY28_9FIRM|nr:XdhC family protein [Halonatronomonas betaini]MBF8438136.1 XdhC family protein [Halonatronomonas betaini]
MNKFFWKELQNLIKSGEAGLIATFIDGDFSGKFSLFDKSDRLVITEDNWISNIKNKSKIDIDYFKNIFKQYKNINQPILDKFSSQNGEVEVYLENLQKIDRLMLFGAGHVAQPLAKIAAMNDFAVEVIDDRADFNNPDNFPDAEEHHCQSFAEFLDNYQPQPGDYIVIVTRGHKHDYDVLKSVISGDWDYLGMIGSKRKVKLLFDDLKEEEFDLNRLEQVDAPIGVEINSETPAEIAVSIMAAMIKRRRSN